MSLMTDLVERSAAFLGNRTSRRGFLARTAVASSALAVAGKRYVLEPKSAYAAICGCNGRSCDCGSLCCDGYTEFCCAIYGENACPPGSVLAGWWKADGSSFCGGAARYYMDCNKACGGCGCGGSGICSGSCTGTPCQCRSCGHRKDGCTHFRYGNCNNQVACVGPILCRIVTCTPPWQLDPSCTTSVRTDNATRNHHRECLVPPPPPPPEPSGQIDSITPEGAGFRVTGRVSDPHRSRDMRLAVYLDRRPLRSVAVDGSGRFSFHVAAPPGSSEICIYAENQGPGEHVRLGCRTVSR